MTSPAKTASDNGKPPFWTAFRREIRHLATTLDLAAWTSVVFEVLGVEEALGDPAPHRDFALQRGEERLVECRLTLPGVSEQERDSACGGRTVRGQCFSSCPSRRIATLEALLALEPGDDRDRSLLLALGNALGVAAGRCGATVHCRDGGPEWCARRMAQEVAARYGSPGLPVGIVGYQPAILGAMTETFGAASVRVLDLNPQNVGEIRRGVRIGHGENDLEPFAQECGLALVTGSTLANDSFSHLQAAFTRHGTPMLFFGTTAALGAEVLGVERWCFESS